MEYNSDDIFNRIKLRREECGYTSLESLCEKIHYTRDSYYKYRRNKKVLPLDTMLKLCELLDCELGYLLCEYDLPNREKTDIHECTGLSDKSIETLSCLKKGCSDRVYYEETLNMLNMILESSNIIDFFEPIADYYRTEVKVNDMRKQPEYVANKNVDYVLGKPEVNRMLIECKRIANEDHPKDAYLIQKRLVDCIEQRAKSDSSNDTVYPIPKVDMEFMEKTAEIEKSFKNISENIAKKKK